MDVPNWVDFYINTIFNPNFWPWLPDEDRSFQGLIEETHREPWDDGRKVGWGVRVAGQYGGMIWGKVEEDVLEVNVVFSPWVKGKDKVEACRIAERLCKALDIDEVFGFVCVENKKSLAFCRYLGYKTRTMYKKNRNKQETEYREVYKCL